MSSIDDTKKKLNIDELDQDSRNKMFNKFVEKGGQIIKENKPKFNYDREKQSLMKQAETLKKKESFGKSPGYRYISSQNKEPEKNQKIKRYYSVLLNGFFQGIFTLSAEFKKKFSSFITEEFVRIIFELSDFLGIFLESTGERKWKNFEIINYSNQYGYELLTRINNLNNKERTSKLENFFRFQNQKIICPQIINELIKIFKDLFILFPYWESLKDIIWKSVELYRVNTNIESTLTKSKINKNIDKIFSYYFPRFLTIINYNTGRKISYEYSNISGNFNIAKNQEMGFITAELNKEKKEFIELQKKQKEETLKKIQAEIEKKEMDKIPKYVQKGLGIIDKIISDIPGLIEKENRLEHLDKTEKMLYFYAIFKEFDLEYSFILTTSQIKFNPKMESGKRIDIKQDFEELYIRFNEIDSFIREYFELTSQLNQIKLQSQSTNQIYETSIENINKKRLLAFNEIRARSISFFKKFAISLQTIIQDYNSEKRLLQNPDQLISFQLEKNANKKFENISIVNAILYAFSFVSAIHYFIEDGKLSGKGLFFFEEEKKEKSPEVENDSSSEEINNQF